MLVVAKKDDSLTQPSRQEVAQAIEHLLPPRAPDAITERSLPKFHVDSTTDLHSALRQRGIADALAQNQQQLPAACVSDFSQRCVIKVDEVGSEAAAVTDMAVNMCRPPSVTRTLAFDTVFSAFVCLEKIKTHDKNREDCLFSPRSAIRPTRHHHCRQENRKKKQKRQLSAASTGCCDVHTEENRSIICG